MTNVVIIGNGVSGKNAAALLAKTKDLKVTIVQANSFVEWSLAMTYVLSAPREHDRFLAPNAETYALKGVEYKTGVVTQVDIAKKQVLLHRDGSSVPYDALIIATGFRLPLVCADAGITLAERKAEIQRAAAAIAAAGTVVVAGGGPVGLELAGDIRVAYPSKKIVLLVRDTILSPYPEKTREQVMKGLQAQNIEVVAGAAAEGVPAEVKFEAGTFRVGDADIAYDVFIPAYSQGPNTKFLQAVDGMLDSKGRIMVNEHLQSKACPEIFSVGVSDLDEQAMIAKLSGQWATVTANVQNLLSQKPLKKHQEGAPAIRLPPLIAVGRGKGGWAHVDFDNLPPPLRCCCCCGVGGFPCCPAPCCWPCCHPCMCGYCGGRPQGSGTAGFLMAFTGKAPSMHFKGWGEAEKAPAQQTM